MHKAILTLALAASAASRFEPMVPFAAEERQSLMHEGITRAGPRDPYVTFTAPVRGARLTAGNSYKISWRAVNAPKGAWVEALRLNSGGSTVMTLLEPGKGRLPATGFGTLRLPGNLVSGRDYYMDIVLSLGESNIALTKSARFAVSGAARAAPVDFPCVKYKDGADIGASSGDLRSCQAECDTMWRTHPAVQGARTFECRFQGRPVWRNPR